MRTSTRQIEDGHLNGYLGGMSDYSISDAKNQLPKLIDRMLAGEAVTITRRGRAVARVVPIEQPEPKPFKWDVERLRKLREAGRTPTSGQTDTVKAMRDDYRY
jgi:prevent-host-death family protein